jgi:rhodanese-related sulfurtransferase
MISWSCIPEENDMPGQILEHSLVIDVRTVQEFDSGHLRAAINIPYTEIAQRIADHVKNKDDRITVYCRSGRRSGIAKKTLETMGYTNVTDAGAYRILKEQEDAARMNEHQRLNRIQVVGSHNSYKQAIAPALLNLIAQDDPKLARSLDYSHIGLTEQLDMGLRGLEIDIFHDPEGGRYARPYGLYGVPGMAQPSLPAYDPDQLMLQPGFKVLHVQDIDFRSHCLTLKKGLEEIKAWSDSHPAHLPIIITMNTNDDVIDRPGFTHPMPIDRDAYDALDRALLAVFPSDRIIRPDDVRGDYATLEQAVLAGNWPTLGTCRGRVMFVLDQGGPKLEAYAQGRPSLKGRVMFVNAAEGRPEAAFRIVNDPIKEAAYIRQLVQKGYLVRTRADADTEEARSGDTARREAAFASGAHVISTDYYRPDPRFNTGYQVKLPGGSVARWNPLAKDSPDFPPSE